MEPKGFHRKLTAILSADVAGYSRLMQDDEAATVKTLEAYKQIISDLVKQHRGRVVDSPGDNLWQSLPAWWMRCSARLRHRRNSRLATPSCPRIGKCSSESGSTWGT